MIKSATGAKTTSIQRQSSRGPGTSSSKLILAQEVIRMDAKAEKTAPFRYGLMLCGRRRLKGTLRYHALTVEVAAGSPRITRWPGLLLSSSHKRALQNVRSGRDWPDRSSSVCGIPVDRSDPLHNAAAEIEEQDQLDRHCPLRRRTTFEERDFLRPAGFEQHGLVRLEPSTYRFFSTTWKRNCPDYFFSIQLAQYSFHSTCSPAGSTWIGLSPSSITAYSSVCVFLP
jgi:hypothetical protein